MTQRNSGPGQQSTARGFTRGQGAELNHSPIEESRRKGLRRWDYWVRVQELELRVRGVLQYVLYTYLSVLIGLLGRPHVRATTTSNDVTYDVSMTSRLHFAPLLYGTTPLCSTLTSCRSTMTSYTI